MLEDYQVLRHPVVIGELAGGKMHNRNDVLHLLKALPEGPIANHAKVPHLINAHRLYGRVGWIDAHLLASALLSG